MEQTIILGALEQVELRQAWPNEAADFTPWLAQAENLRLLGDTIGIELELEGTERNVGTFHADILCKDTRTSDWVLIENQLEKTDHTHLGQLMTYAAGLQAVVIVWIAKRITPEHRAAIDWLNEITEEKFNFFALEIELWRIGNSAVAPKFNVVCKPNDWTKTVGEGAKQPQNGSLTEAKQLQLEYWEAFREFALENGSAIKPTKPLPQNWMTFAVGRSGCHLAAVVSTWAESYGSHEIRAEVVFDSDAAKIHFAFLEAQKAAIEKEMGEALIWHNSPERKGSKIYVRNPVNLDDRSTWPEQRDWLLKKLSAFHKVFSARVKQLPDDVDVPEADIPNDAESPRNSPSIQIVSNTQQS